MANLIPLKSVSSDKEPIYDEPEYDYAKLSPDDVQFVGAQEDGYVRIASEKMTGTFNGPVSAKGRPPRTQERYSSKPAHTIQDGNVVDIILLLSPLVFQKNIVISCTLSTNLAV